MRIEIPDFKSEKERIEYLMGRCTSTTRSGHRCKNPVFHDQWFSWPRHCNCCPNRDESAIYASVADVQTWRSGRCRVHRGGV